VNTNSDSALTAFALVKATLHDNQPDINTLLTGADHRQVAIDTAKVACSFIQLLAERFSFDPDKLLTAISHAVILLGDDEDETP
jgi:hypothetical protein